MTLDQILRELSSISERLIEAVDAEERLELTSRRDELRRLARDEVPASRSDMERELARLVAAWERLQKQRIDVVKQAGDLAAGNFGFTSDAMRLNRQIDEAAGRTELEARIKELKARLAGEA